MEWYLNTDPDLLLALGTPHEHYRYMKEFDKGVSVTNAALEYGCAIDETTPYDLFLPNPLFEIFIHAGFASRCEEAQKYFFKIGYEMEQRTEGGEILLLHAVTALSSEHVKRFKILMEKEGDIHAIDAQGRSALHCAFLAPSHFREDERLGYWEGAPQYLFVEKFSHSNYILKYFENNEEGYAEGHEDLQHDFNSLTRNCLVLTYISDCDSSLIIPNRNYRRKCTIGWNFQRANFEKLLTSLIWVTNVKQMRISIILTSMILPSAISAVYLLARPTFFMTIHWLKNQLLVMVSAPELRSITLARSIKSMSLTIWRVISVLKTIYWLKNRLLVQILALIMTIMMLAQRLSTMNRIVWQDDGTKDPGSMVSLNMTTGILSEADARNECQGRFLEYG